MSITERATSGPATIGLAIATADAVDRGGLAHLFGSGFSWQRFWAAADDLGIPRDAVTTPLAMMAVCVGWIALTGVHTRIGDFAKLFYIQISLYGPAIYLAWRGHARLASTIGCFGVLQFSVVAGGLLSFVGLTAGPSLIDAQLAAVDEAMGFHHAAMMRGLAGFPLTAWALAGIYAVSMPLAMIVACTLAMRGEVGRLRCFMRVWTQTLAIIITMSLLWPAIGTYVHYDLSKITDAFMPPAAGIFHLASFKAIYANPSAFVSPLELNAVVTFPSFHMCMAMIIAYGLWTIPVLRWIGVAICVTTIVGTVLVGGHYVIDVLAGGLLFAVALCFASPPVASAR